MKKITTSIMKELVKQTFLVLLTICFTPVMANAATYYVNNAYSSSGSGTSPTDPFITIQEGVNAATSAGDVVVVAAGTYAENVTLTGVDITLRGRSCSTTILDGSSVGGKGITINSGESRATKITNLAITNYDYGILVEESSPTLRSLCLESSSGNGILVEGTSSNPKIYQNILTSSSGSGGSWAKGTFGVQVSEDASGMIFGNEVSGFFSGIILDDVSICQIVNNLIYGGFYGITDENYLNSFYPVSVHIIAFNTIASNQDAGFTAHAAISGSIALIVNNIFYGNTFGLVSGGTSEIGYNDSYGNISSNFDGVYTDLGGNMEVDPLFIDAASNDFHLDTSSPLVGAANTRLYRTRYDFDHVLRGDHGCSSTDGVDIGALECQP